MTKKTEKTNDVRFVLFGTGDIAREACEEFARAGFMPALVVTAPDAPAGRKMSLAPSPVAEWAEAHGVPAIKPERAKDAADRLRSKKWDVFIVVDYGLLLPREILDIPKQGCLNIHPSLLPRLRGPSPIRSAILNDVRPVGVSIILLDEELDHGPLVAQKRVDVPDWPPRGTELDVLLAREGARLLLQVILQWVKGEVKVQEQNHDIATYCEKFKKEDGLLDLAADAYQNLLKIRAYEGWPGTYAFFERSDKKIRAQILDAHLDASGTLVIDSVKPEGKREMSYEAFLRSGAQPTH